MDRILWNSVDWLFPPECASCHQSNYILCPDCEKQAELILGHVCEICGIPIDLPNSKCVSCLTSSPFYSGMRSWAHYKASIREAIHSLKYKNNIPLGYYFSSKLIPIIKNEQWPVDLIVPVPLNLSHLKERGFNQSALISRPIAHSIQIPFSTRALHRSRETAPQFSLSAEERFRNVEDAFSGNAATLIDKTVLLVDDVITTGATMENCTKALLEAGAKKVYCISVARVCIEKQ